MKIVYKKISSLPEFIEAIRIRVDVFIIEQNCKPGWEPDEEDKTSEHYIAVVEKNIVATARVRGTKNKEYKIERMAIKKEFRKKGFGKGLILYILSQINKRRPRRIWIQAQVQAQKFYERCGFSAISREYDLYGIPHIDMEYGRK